MRCPNPARHFTIEIAHFRHAEVMRMTTRREGFDLVETIALDPARQNEMTNEMRLSRHGAGETHARLKNHPRLLRDHVHVATGVHHARKFVE